MVQMTPTKIFRKTAVATDIVRIFGFVVFVGVIGYFVYAVF